jgi:LCP family protein required for cell wall assembly
MAKKIFLGLILISLILLLSGGIWCGYYIKKTYFAPLPDCYGKINFLLLGINGGGSPGDDLTDSMIFVSLNRFSKKAVLISLPRDLWIPSIQAKINTAYHYGGFDLAKKVAGEVLGQNIDYVAVVSFEDFKAVIDSLGGIEVEVLRGFDDLKYPVKGKENDPCGGDKEYKCRYEHLHFDAGLQKMDGETALKFVRSRNAEGDEGTDFARSLRQQQLLKALKTTIISQKLYLKPKRALDVARTLQAAIKTDFPQSQYGSLLVFVSKINLEGLKAAAVDENLLIHPKTHSSKQWVLLPKSGDWKEIQKFTSDLLR